jgi:hypothetical protein
VDDGGRKKPKGVYTTLFYSLFPSEEESKEDFSERMEVVTLL